MIGSWINNTPLASGMPFANGVSVSYNDYIYFIGGDNAQTASNAVRYAKVGTNGTLEAWYTTTSMPLQLTSLSATVVSGNTHGYLYVLGGSNFQSLSGNFYYAMINTDGTLGAWQTQKTAFTDGIVGATINMFNSYMLVAGGYNLKQSFQYVSIYQVNLNTGAINVDSSGFPINFKPPVFLPFIFPKNYRLSPLDGYAFGSTLIVGDYIYAIGGYTIKKVDNKQVITPSNRISYAQITPIGGITIQPFKTETVNSLPVSIARFGGFNSGNVIYVAGGDNGTIAVDTVYYSVINPSDGTIGSWTNSASLPRQIQGMGITLSGNFVYIVSGVNNVGIIPNVYSTNSNLPGVFSITATTEDVGSDPVKSQTRLLDAIVAFTYTDGGQTVTSFTATSTPGNISATNTTGSPITIPGINFGVTYTFKITLTNSVGTTTSDISSSPVTAIPDFRGEGSPYVFVPAKVANRPFDVRATPINETSAIVNFTPAGYTGIKYNYDVPDPTINPPLFDSFYNIVGYTVSCLPGNAVANGPNPSIVLSGLTPGGKYKFGARTTNDSINTKTQENGNSLWSDVTEEITLRITSTPSPPTNVTATAGNGMAIVSFTPPTNTGNAPITKYVVTADTGISTADGTSSPIIISGLTNGVPVSFTVTATNGAYTSNASVISPVVTPALWVSQYLFEPLSCVSVSGNNCLVGGQSRMFLGTKTSRGWSFSAISSLPSQGGWTAASISSNYALAGNSTQVYGGFYNGTTWVWTLLNSVSCTACRMSGGKGLFSSSNNLYTVSSSSSGAWTTSVVPAFAGSTITTITIDGNLGLIVVGQGIVSAKYNGSWEFNGTNIIGIPQGVTTVVVSGIYATAVSQSSLYYGSYNSALNIWAWQITNSEITSALYQSSSMNGNNLLLGTTGGGNAYSAVFSNPVWTLTDVTTDPTYGITASDGKYSVSTDGTTNFIATTGGNIYFETIGQVPQTVIYTSAITTDVGTYVYFQGNNDALVYTANAYQGTTLVSTGSYFKSPVFVRNLDNNTSYTFKVYGTNMAGIGDLSAATNQITTPSTQPDPPVNVVASALSSSASVSFYPPTNNGGLSVLDYTVTSSPGGFTSTSASSPITVTGLTNGVSYTFTVTARNSVGTSVPSSASNAVIPSTTPGPPTNVVATASNTTATVTFSAPSNTGGSAIQYYTITYGSIYSKRVTGTSATITGLTNGISYTFGVTATNSASTSSSAQSNAVIPHIVVPTAPTNVTAAAIRGGANISFRQPITNGGSLVLDFTVTSIPGGITRSGVYSPIAITGLNPGQTYSFSVTARNSVGVGSAATSNNITVPAAINLPTSIVVTPLNRSATISFNGTGTGASNYYVVSNPGNISVTVPATITSIDVPNLVNGTSYTFTLTASNNIGSVSTLVGPAIPRTVPSTPTNLSAQPGNTTAVVSFSPPVNNGGNTITGYRVTSNPGSIITTGLSSPITVTGLTNGTSYTFTIAAANAAGYSVESYPTSPVIPATNPDPPTGVTAIGKNTSATVSFTPPVNTGGGPILDYTVYSSNGGPTVVGVSSPINITGLVNGQQYTFTVKARNQVYYSTLSSASNSITPFVTVPNPPTNLVATLQGPAPVNLLFSPPTNNGGSSLLGYSIYASDPPGITGSAFAAENPLMLVFGVTLGTTYRFKVAAQNSQGYSIGSEFSNYITPSGTPMFPTSLVATPLVSAASVNFVQPTDTGSTPITSYVVTSSPGGVTGSGVTPPIIVNGLTNGISYNFRAVATNSSGFSGPPSPASNTVVPANLPNPPTSVSGVPGDSSVTVSFVPPVNNGGSAIIGYTVTSSPDGISRTGAASPIIIPGLANGIRYTFTVVATNAIGNSVSSNASLAFVPTTTPPPPSVGLVASVVGSNASIAFTYPNNTSGSSIIDYTATSFSNNPATSGITGTSSTTPITVSNIPKGFPVSFKVKSRNLSGSGSFSNITNSITILTVPEAPTNVVATPGNMQSSVAFTAPVDNGGTTITEYIATSSPGGMTGSSPNSPIQVNGLSNDGTPYTFTVTARNAQGLSAISAVSNIVINGTDPTPPSNIAAQPLNASASISFTPPVYPIFTGGTPIVSYTVTSTPDNVTATGASSPVLITGLRNNTSYTFRVKSTNASGFTTLVASDPTAPVTPKSTKWGGVFGGVYENKSWSCVSVSGQYALVGTNNPNNNMYFAVLQSNNSWVFYNISYTTPINGQLPQAPWSCVSIYTVSVTEAYALIGSTNASKAIYGGFYNGTFWKWNQISVPVTTYTSALSVQAGVGAFYLSESKLYTTEYINGSWEASMVDDPFFDGRLVPSISFVGNLGLGATNFAPIFVILNDDSFELMGNGLPTDSRNWSACAMTTIGNTTYGLLAENNGSLGNNRVYFSRYTTSWSPWTVLGIPQNNPWISMSIAPRSSSTLYALFSNNQGFSFSGLYNGSTWTFTNLVSGTPDTGIPNGFQQSNSTDGVSGFVTCSGNYTYYEKI